MARGMAFQASIDDHSITIESPVPLKPSIGAGRHPQIFQPPDTPLSVQSSFAHRLGDLATNNSRKRARPSSRDVNFETPYTQQWNTFSAESSAIRSDAASPLPFINTQYNLRGGLDTPTREYESQYDGMSEYKEADFRRRWSTSSARQEDGTPYPKPGLRLGGERNGRRRFQSSPNGSGPASPSWGKLVNGIFGVAGKMWHFCKTSAFKGFYAGGGRGYEVKPAQPQRDDLQESNAWEDMETSQHESHQARETSPMPGMWPEQHDYFGNIDSVAESAQKRPAKKSRTETGAGWIMVDSEGNAQSPVPTPGMSARRTPSSFNSQLPRPIARPNLRRSLQPASRRSSVGSPAAAGNPRRLSHQPVRSPGFNSGTPSKPAKDSSPVSIEAQRYAERMRREERQADASIRRLNDRLSAMIKEGKEALGTKIEIVDDNAEDEGFFQ
jgi:hypothetical protein